ncbi:hypothetical protein NIES4071_90410 [Calothrix sp. NIES-4071]|nr:hypothetical protein NIES4071_90410 [Calothrix sp. NIES-4071]BAZ63308.1 hypothetical protein NIES4105_90340 [Calothrix sp. NIES-4105]
MISTASESKHMSQNLTISASDIIQNIKLSCQIPSVVQAIASQKIIAQAAQELGIRVEDNELQQEGDSLRMAYKLVKAKDTWNWLKTHELSMDDFEQLVHNRVLSRKLASHLFSGEVEKFFYQNKLNYAGAVTYEVVLENRDLALELFYAVQEGEITFAEIARQYIHDPEQRRAGGYQGLRYRKEFRPEIAAPVFAAASAPQILKPISTAKETYLIWVEEIIQPELNEQLRQKIITEMFYYWLQQQIQASGIVMQLDCDNPLQAQDKLLKQA